jgi:hypothetical protein
MVVLRPERSVERLGLPCLQRAAPAIDTIAYKKAFATAWRRPLAR